MDKDKDIKKFSGKKFITALLIGATVSSVVLPLVSVFAEEGDDTPTVISETQGDIMLLNEVTEVNEVQVVDEKWGKPTFVVGGGLTEIQIDETLKVFGVDKDSVLLETANGEDLIRYLGEGEGNTASMISSVLVKKQNAKKGISVEIVNPENITRVTPMQYKKAVINLGVEGVDLKITSINPATGESALTGVYKALELNGEEFSEGQMELSNAETELFAEVNEQNADKDEFNPDEVTLLISELQKEVADLKKGGEPVTDENLKDLVEKSVKDKGLESYIKADTVNVIVDTLNIFQNNPELVDNEQILKGTEDLADSLGESLKDGFNYFKDKVGSTEVISEESKGLFQKMMASITNFFNKLFNKVDEVDTEKDTSDSTSVDKEKEEQATKEPIEKDKDKDATKDSMEKEKKAPKESIENEKEDAILSKEKSEYEQENKDNEKNKDLTDETSTTEIEASTSEIRN